MAAARLRYSILITVVLVCAAGAALLAQAPPAAMTAADYARAEKFLAEVGWREFAHHLLVHFPHTTAAPRRPSPLISSPGENAPPSISTNIARAYPLCPPNGSNMPPL